MASPSARIVPAALSLLMIVYLSTGLMAQVTGPDSKTDVEADEIQPAGAPIRIRITVTNAGKKPISYWCGSVEKFPSADLFEARITDDRGKTRKADLSNAQARMGSGVMVQIQPGEAVTLPAALHSLPIGSYTIQVGKGKTAKVTVKDDFRLLRTYGQDLLKRIREGDRLAKHLAAKFPTEEVTKALVKDLLSDDQKVAFQAANTLCCVEKLPADTGAMVNKAVLKNIDAQATQQNHDLLEWLAFLAADVGSDEALSAVLLLIEKKRAGGSEIAALGKFKQERAAKALRDALKDENLDNRFEAARTLAIRKDPAALDVLLEVAGDSQTMWRAYAYHALANYPADPRVEPVLKKGLKDEDSFTRGEAESALRQVRSKQKP